MSKLTNVLFVLLAIACAISLITFLPFVSAFVASFLLWGFYRPNIKKRLDLTVRGFRVEYHDPNAERGDHFEIVYHEGWQHEDRIWLYGIESPDGNRTLIVPAPSVWVASMPNWAEHRRDEIITRIREARPKMIVKLKMKM